MRNVEVGCLISHSITKTNLEKTSFFAVLKIHNEYSELFAKNTDRDS